ncbi:hypothetical protein B0H13DRAFT_1863935 [Mycena leptocephala]|nr:hypothetical protein B0H13DRAFT_1863935 [Mycena leptocephala]
MSGNSSRVCRLALDRYLCLFFVAQQRSDVARSCAIPGISGRLALQTCTVGNIVFYDYLPGAHPHIVHKDVQCNARVIDLRATRDAEYLWLHIRRFGRAFPWVVVWWVGGWIGGMVTSS